MKSFFYICIWIVGGNCPMKAETRTPLPDTFVRDILKTGKMKTIPLTQGKIALVDDEDFEYLNQWKWFARKNKHNYYVCRRNGKKHILLHNVIMNPSPGFEVDHRDRNGLNCQRKNMRIATHSQNQSNKRSQINGTSKYLGVHYKKSKGYSYICAAIQSNHIQLHLGTFKTEEDAARAYDNKAKELHGEFANLNFK